MNTPLVLHFYNPVDSEIEKTFTRSFIPWKLLKVAVRLSKKIDPNKPEEVDEETLEELSNMIVATFGDSFSLEDLETKADTQEVFAIFHQIVNTAFGNINPTLPAK